MKPPKQKIQIPTAFQHNSTTTQCAEIIEESLQCCQTFPARSSAFFVASPTFCLHRPNTSRTVSIVSANPKQKKQNQKNSRILLKIQNSIRGKKIWDGGRTPGIGFSDRSLCGEIGAPADGFVRGFWWFGRWGLVGLGGVGFDWRRGRIHGSIDFYYGRSDD